MAKLFTIAVNGADQERYEPIRPHFADPQDVPRLTGQNERILARLREGPATNVELAAVSLKYTGRISDIRAWLEKHRSQTVVCRKGKGGLNTYEITKGTTDGKA